MFRRVAVLSFCIVSAWGAVVRVEVSQRSDVLGGKSFGAAGAFERITGKVWFAVDPKLEANRIIRDVLLAPRNSEGLVEFSADLYMLRPRDPARGNRSVLYEVSNRGGKGMLAVFNRAASSFDPRTSPEFGDGFLLEHGFTLVWLGWQFDVPRRDGLVRLFAPVASEGGKTITGLVRSEFVPDEPETAHSLADRAHVPYAPVNPDDPSLRLTVRASALGERRTVPRGWWRIGGDVIRMPAGFRPGQIYELVYEAKDPVVAGLGPAAVRDFISFLKYQQDVARMPDAQPGSIARAYGFGVSQSGRFLRTFLYFGFNGDEKGRKVFNGILSHVAGGGRGSFNHRFAQPSRDGHPFLNMLFPTDIFPFTDASQTDPENGITDGLMSRAESAGVRPKVFYTNASYEYYGRAASLIHTSLDGARDIEPHADTRIYFFTGGQHGPAGFPPARKGTRNLANPNDYRWSMRALLLRMHQWVAAGKVPPPSRYPLVSRGELVPLGQVHFPKIPGTEFPGRMHSAWRVDYGPEFRSKGIVTLEPPKVGKAFGMRVPQVNADGNEISGVAMPGIQAPLATHAGWNLRAPELGAQEELFSMAGSWIPFPRDKAERERSGDPRPSIAERYSGREDYLAKVRAAADRLVKEGYLLAIDVPAILERATAEWDYLSRSN